MLYLPPKSKGENFMIKTASFAARIKEYRASHNMTLSQMEAKTGVPGQTINRYELGQRMPKIDMANKIAAALNVNFLWLQGYDVPEKQEEPADKNIDRLRKLLEDPDFQLIYDKLAKLSPRSLELAKIQLDSLLKAQDKQNKQEKQDKPNGFPE
jgi:repressor LexA